VVDCPALLLDGLHRHIAHQVDGAVVDRPHIIKCALIPDVVVKQDILSIRQALPDLPLQILLLDIVRPVKVRQIQVARIPFPHPLGLEDKSLALCVHNIQRCLFIVKTGGGKGAVQKIIHVFNIQPRNLRPVPDYGALQGISPCPHIVEVGLGHGQTVYRTACGKIQSRLGKDVPGIGNALRFPGEDQGHLYHCLVFLIGADIFLRAFRLCNFAGNQGLKLCFIFEDGLNGAFDQLQALA
jgi:hypothetical protein